ncbi:MAG: VOC family protein [Ilumatobacteraceae bacterium]
MPTPTPRHEYPAGVPCWIDLEPADVGAAIDFYGAVLGWTFEDRLPPDAPGRYAIASVDGLTVGAVGSASERADGAATWNTYVSVTDVEAVVAAAVAAGGDVVAAPGAGAPPGRSAVVADPSGAAIRLWQPGTNPGAELVNANGAWNWSNLHTPDGAVVAGFYVDVFGWELERLPLGGVYAQMWRRPGYGDFLAEIDPGIAERQDGAGAPPGFADAIAWLVEDPGPSHWQVTFTVDDTDEATRRVTKRGGAVLTEPYDEGPTRLAVVADDQGTVFSLNTFYPERLADSGR